MSKLNICAAAMKSARKATNRWTLLCSSYRRNLTAEKLPRSNCVRCEVQNNICINRSEHVSDMCTCPSVCRLEGVCLASLVIVTFRFWAKKASTEAQRDYGLQPEKAYPSERASE